ncbi:hypothetical protein C8R45DRAFT_973782 [Mycena sanguinolenta]|nr:hypothetical protein C8R45DRAFT_973782 [Mycena sanguinolenta]
MLSATERLALPWTLASSSTLDFSGCRQGSPKTRIFETTLKDAYGMPQPAKYTEQTQRMMNDMTDVANKLGAYLPKSEPQFMTPGLALHLGGTTRLGLGKDKGETVADFNSQV